MGRRRDGDEHVRKLFRTGGGRTIAVTLPVAMVRALRWQEGQKVIFELKNKKLTIVDWES